MADPLPPLAPQLVRLVPPPAPSEPKLFRGERVTVAGEAVWSAAGEVWSAGEAGQLSEQPP